MTSNDAWPPLSLAEWKPSCETLHLWLQVAGKVRLALTPLVNHWWNTTLYLTARGMTTSAMPYRDGALEIRFDFIDHTLTFAPSWTDRASFDLRPECAADFYQRFFAALASIGVHDIHIEPMSCELPVYVRLDQDRSRDSFDRDAVNRWWRATLSSAKVLEEFRGRFIGKSSPVHFFWGSFDLAVTRFSGRRAPARPGADAVTAEAYSHEVISAGFWPGSGTVTDAAYYAYAAPAPEGFDRARVEPSSARYDTTLGEFLLMYEDVRTSSSPHDTLMAFLESTYAAAATLAKWDRAELERKEER